ncbi:MAG: histidine--tRNA ligase, partial [Psychrilyobacter sp.]|nr:histidine--tRNA ligase [Psychrilyobacter sp.]
MKLIKAMRGTRDIYDGEAKKFNFIEDKAKELLENYGFGRIITPTFESTDLFKRGIGEGTDIVDKEMYTFSDRGDRSITLRPEGTAPVVRSYLENKTYGREDLTKYYYINNMFRYERPQAGRYREFYQIGVEILGNGSPMADAEVISMGYRLMEKLGIEDLKVNINSVGGNETRANY